MAGLSNRAQALRPKLVRSGDDLAGFLSFRRHERGSPASGKIAEMADVPRSVVKQIEDGETAEGVAFGFVRRVVNALGFDVELRPQELPFVPVPPKLVNELALSAGTLAALEAAGVREVDQLGGASDLFEHPSLGSGVEVYELVCALNRHGLTLPIARGYKVPQEREREMFRLRAVEGQTLDQIGQHYGVIGERVRQILASYFGLSNVPPAATAAGRRQRREES